MKHLFRIAGWLAVAGLLGAALIGPSTVIASDPVYATVTGHQAFSEDANHPDYWGEDCTKTEFEGDGPDSFVLTEDYALVVVKAGAGAFAHTLFADASAGETVWADTNGDGVFNADVEGMDKPEGGFDKNISHIIFCPLTTTTTTETTESTTETTTETTSSETTETTTANTPEGSVEAETGTPEATPPSTDTIGPGSTPSNGSWQPALIALAGLLTMALVLTPSTRRTRR